jgi:hypothetical protein
MNDAKRVAEYMFSFFDSHAELRPCDVLNWLAAQQRKGNLTGLPIRGGTPKSVRNEFRKIHKGSIIWDAGKRCWRERQEGDA